MKRIKFFENFNEVQKEGRDVQNNPNEIYILVGPPAVGKSTWLENNLMDKNPHIINRDLIVEQVAEEMGLTYDDMFSVPGVDKKEGDVDDKFGTVIKSPSWMTWQKLSYDKISQANQEIQRRLDRRISESSEKSCVVVDMTNMTKKSRKGMIDKVLAATGSGYKKIAVDFEFKVFEDVIYSASEKRSREYKQRGKSKTISKKVLNRMFSHYETVDDSEGFDEIIVVPHY